MSSRRQYTPAQRKAWGRKMAAARAAKAGTISGRGAYYKKDKATGQMRKVKKSHIRQKYGSSSNMLATGGSALGGAIAAGLGLPPQIGSAIGGLGGNLLNEGIKFFTGKGDYEVVNNSFLKGEQFLEPINNPHHTGGNVFRRSEYLGDIISSSTANTFKLQSFPVNPGLEGTFEWLSQIAANYEEYSFEGLYFEYRSMSADALNSVNTALGQVIMAANYNAASPNFTNKQVMENYEGGISGKPSCSVRYFVECAKNQTVLDELYIRQGSVPTGQDPRLYDLCNFQIATNGLQGTSVNLGELWVTYQVCLRKPKLFAALGQYNSFVSASPLGGTYTNASPLGNGSVWNYSPSNTLNGVVITGNSISWLNPTLPQTYCIQIIWSGTAAVISVPAITANSATGLTVQIQSSSPAPGATSSLASTTVFVTYQPSLQTSGSPNTGVLVSNAGTLPTGPGQGVSIYMFQMPNTLYAI